MKLTDTEKSIIVAALEAYAHNQTSEKRAAQASLEFVKDMGGTPAEVAEKEAAVTTVENAMATAHDLAARFSAE